MIDDVIKTMDKITRTILYVNTTKLARLLDFNGEISSLCQHQANRYEGLC